MGRRIWHIVNLDRGIGKRSRRVTVQDGAADARKMLSDSIFNAVIFNNRIREYLQNRRNVML